MNDDDIPVPNKNVAPPQVDGAWKADVPNENGAAGVIALASSYGLDEAGVAPKLKLVLIAVVTLLFFFSASGAGVNPQMQKWSCRREARTSWLTPKRKARCD